MAIMDRLASFSNKQDLQKEAGTYVFDSSYDMGAAALDPGNGQPLYVNMVVTDAFTDGGDSATLEFQIISDDNAALTSPSIHLKSGTFLKAALTAGKHFSFPLPAAGRAYERYLGVQAVVATAGFDSGKVTAWLAWEPSANIKVYPDGQH